MSAGEQARLPRHKCVEPRDDFEARYIAQLLAEGLADHTIRKRIYLMRALGVSPAEATVEDVVAVLTQPHLSQHTRAAYSTCLRTVFADLNRMGWIDNDPMRRVKQPRSPRREPRPIPEQHLRRILSMDRERERSWAILGAYAGLRAGEVLSLTGQSLRDSDRGPVLEITGKGGVRATVPAHPKVVQVLEPYAGQERVLWFMWPQSLDKAWAKAMTRLGLPGYHFHQLRHTYCTNLLRKSGDLLLVSRLARHASVATTQRYTALADDAPYALIGEL